MFRKSKWWINFEANIFDIDYDIIKKEGNNNLMSYKNLEIIYNIFLQRFYY